MRDGECNGALGALQERRGDPAPFITDGEGKPLGEREGIHRLAGGVGRPERDVVNRQVLLQRFSSGVKGVMLEMCSHRATDDFGVPKVNGPGEGDGGGHAERGGGAQDSPDVAGILHAVEDEESDLPVRGDLGERAFWELDDGEDPLRRFGLGGAPEIVFGHFAQAEIPARDLLT